MSAYYNEINLHAAQWLRNLITAGHIADGVVDTRSIEDVQPDDLREFTQCHFFAGVGVWSYALRRAGWGDDRPVWTGSCPCQPFSAAGEGLAFADERHLWPAFHHLIKECKPPIVVGEQVASKAVDAWIDLVHADLEAVGYTFGSVPFPSAGVGAPHIRDRNYWVGVGQADANHAGLEGRSGMLKRAAQFAAGACGMAGKLEHTGLNHDAGQGQASNTWQSKANRSADIAGRSGVSLVGMANLHGNGCSTGAGPELHNAEHNAESCGSVRGLADAERFGIRNEKLRSIGGASGGVQGAKRQREWLWTDTGAGGATMAEERPGPTNGFWSAADWLGCTDGKWRPVEPGTFPLVARTPDHVGQLRAYGNAINAEAARVFVEAVMEATA